MYKHLTFSPPSWASTAPPLPLAAQVAQQGPLSYSSCKRSECCSVSCHSPMDFSGQSCSSFSIDEICPLFVWLNHHSFLLGASSLMSWTYYFCAGSRWRPRTPRWTCCHWFTRMDFQCCRYLIGPHPPGPLWQLQTYFGFILNHPLRRYYHSVH